MQILRYTQFPHYMRNCFSGESMGIHALAHSTDLKERVPVPASAFLAQSMTKVTISHLRLPRAMWLDIHELMNPKLRKPVGKCDLKCAHECALTEGEGWTCWRRSRVKVAASFCPSCTGRRMPDTAAHRVVRVFPEARVRPWVLSLPFALGYRLAYDKSLVWDILQIFARAVFGSLRRRARKREEIRETQYRTIPPSSPIFIAPGPLISPIRLRRSVEGVSTEMQTREAKTRCVPDIHAISETVCTSSPMRCSRNRIKSSCLGKLNHLFSCFFDLPPNEFVRDSGVSGWIDRFP